MRIRLVRHASSKHNTGELNASEIGDHNVPLSSCGPKEAFNVGRAIGSKFFNNSLVYASPYTRTRETLMHILKGADVDTLKGTSYKIYEDPRIREMEWGWNKCDTQKENDELNRDKFGYFYYRIPGGESPADCYDRVSGFIDSLHRQIERKKPSNVLLVTHGIVIRVFVMRWLHLTPEDYDNMYNPSNCQVVDIAFHENLVNPKFISGRWGVQGIRLRSE